MALSTLRLLLPLLPVLTSAALAQTTAPAPDLDCSIGYEGLHAAALSLPGVQADPAHSNRVIVENPDVWRVEFSFSEPGQPAHPAVTFRKFVKQVTGVWTAQSKGCGFGDPVQFASLMTEMKSADTTLTNASRADVERQKQETSPLGASP